MLWYWLIAAPAVLLALASLRGEWGRAAWWRRRLGAGGGALPPVSVIVPVKGADEGLRENLAALASLDYPDYELIVAAREACDIPPGVLPARVKVALAETGESATAEKILNLLAGVKAARKVSQAFVFADSDGRPEKGWLRALIGPLGEAGVGAVTGFRWFLPDPPGFWSLLRAVWDAVAAGVLGPGDNRFAWGGATAIRKETFFEAKVPDRWEGALTDDYPLSRAVHAAGLTVAFAPGALTPSMEHVSAGRFLSWSRRQMAITRVYAPGLWWPGLIAHAVYCAAMAASVAAMACGYWPAAAALALQLAPGMWKGRRRAELARGALPSHGRWFRRWGWAHAALSPLATWAWLAALASSAVARRIEWRGRVYEVARKAR